MKKKFGIGIGIANRNSNRNEGGTTHKQLHCAKVVRDIDYIRNALILGCCWYDTSHDSDLRQVDVLADALSVQLVDASSQAAFPRITDH